MEVFIMNKKQNTKSNYIYLRVTDKQKNNIKKTAELQNKTMSEYILNAIDFMSSYNNLINYVNQKITYYKTINKPEIVEIYLDVLMKLSYDVYYKLD